MPPEHLNFAYRVEPEDLPEWMDEPCSYEDFRQCLLDLAQVNRLSVASRPTLNFVERVTVGLERAHPLRIVDVGSGGGDMLRRIEQWAKRRHIAVKLTGIDLNPYATRASKEFTPSGSAIQWLTCDAYAYKEPIDVVLSSLFTHHLSEVEVVRFLAWSEDVARIGWFVNDLVRAETPYKLFSALSKLMGWHRFVQHDGPASFRRSFREEDWERMLTSADIEGAALRRWTPGRLCVERLK